MVNNNQKNNRNYRNGGVSLIAVIFGTMVMSLICLSFINNMRSGLSQNVAYTTSQAAYDSAITGMNDAHIAINDCKRFPNGNSALGFSANDCAVILRSRHSNCNQTIQAVANVVGIPPGVVNSDSNQFYTCISIDPLDEVYKGRLEAQNPIATIPLGATDSNGNAAQVRKVGIYWYRRGTPRVYNPDSSANQSCGTFIFGSEAAMNNRVPGLCAGRYLTAASLANEAPIIGVELSQLPTTYNMGNLISDNDGLRTNHGFMMLAPTASGASHTFANTQVNGVNRNFAGSADHALQSPAAARCDNGRYNSTTNTDGEFRCGALIDIPEPRGGGNRDLSFSFIRLSLPHLETEPADFEIRYYDANGNELRFTETQFEVAVQGKAGDRVRRLRGFIGGVRGTLNDILPDYSAVIDGSAEVRKCIDSNGGNANCGANDDGPRNEATYESTLIDWEYRLTCSYRFYTGQNELGNQITTSYEGANPNLPACNFTTNNPASAFPSR
jgi:hypothetical protein